MTIDGLRRLKVWVRAKDFALQVYHRALPLPPPQEKWNLNQQLRRSCVSVAANIAEGYGRFYYQENVRFCYIARGSLNETIGHLSFAFEVKYLPAEVYSQLELEGNEVDRTLNGYIAYLKKSKQGLHEPGSSGFFHAASPALSADSPDD